MIVPCMFVVDGQYGKTGFLNLSHVVRLSFTERDCVLTPRSDWSSYLTPEKWTSGDFVVVNGHDVSVVWTPELAAAWESYVVSMNKTVDLIGKCQQKVEADLSRKFFYVSKPSDPSDWDFSKEEMPGVDGPGPGPIGVPGADAIREAREREYWSEKYCPKGEEGPPGALVDEKPRGPV
jgi:hypothetical protein